MEVFSVKSTAIICFAVTILSGIGCNSNYRGTTDQTTNFNANTAVVVSSTPAATMSNANLAQPDVGTGEAVDTAKYDAEIVRLEKIAEKSPSDETARVALSKSYLARANALSGGRQYRAALSDYRRVLRYDPDNEEAQQMAATITNILKERGREVPDEGDEPVPLPLVPENIGGEKTSANPKNSTQRNKVAQGKKP